MAIKIILKIFVNRKIAYILMGNMKDYQGLFIRAVKVDFVKKSNMKMSRNLFFELFFKSSKIKVATE